MTRESGGPGNVSPSWNLVLLTRLLLQTTHSRLNLKRIETGSGNWSCLSYSGRCLLACAWPINPLLYNSSTALRSIGRGYVVCVCVCVCVCALFSVFLSPVFTFLHRPYNNKRYWVYCATRLRRHWTLTLILVRQSRAHILLEEPNRHQLSVCSCIVRGFEEEKSLENLHSVLYN